ncbi:MAG: Gfo/Idh/MocA family oxidoreductase [Acidobacteriaceae bacterium]|nr:Gfo/Idh/MocA family oxidoreductase [Acidobacteriaceae bacterium]
MSIKDALGLGSSKKVRYGMVALGDITQEAMLPGVEHTGNSEVAALVTSNSTKAREVGKQYGVSETYSYDQFEQLLHSGKIDAVYVATPNWRHAEFIIPALKAGIHVLAEKPLEVSTAKCREILDVQKNSSAKLMVAYRLHFEPATLSLIEQIRAGKLGSVHLFSSVFAQMLDPQNHRAKNGDLAGPVLDMGPYPVNAARYVFESEPTEVVSASGTRHPESGLGDFDDTVAVTLRFPENRIAQFTISYYGNTIDSYTVVGTEGNIVMSPGFMYGKPLEQEITIGQKKTNKSFKNTDHFGGEMKYFSDCILNGQDPEPDGEEGYADVRVLEAILRALKEGTPQKLEPFTRSRRIDTKSQEQTLSAQRSPELVETSNPGKGQEKIPKN